MTNAQLSKIIEEQTNTINYLTNRIGQLVDDMSILQTEVNTFKAQVANDMQRVVKTIQTR